jgi:hypothetical protein
MVTIKMPLDGRFGKRGFQKWTSKTRGCRSGEQRGTVLGRIVEMVVGDPRLKEGGKHARPPLAVFLALSLAFNVTSLAVLGNVFLPGAYA